jgi:hypothetical protein
LDKYILPQIKKIATDLQTIQINAQKNRLSKPLLVTAHFGIFAVCEDYFLQSLEKKARLWYTVNILFFWRDRNE